MQKRIAGFLHYRTDLGDGVRTGIVFSDCIGTCHRICTPYHFLPEHNFSDDTLEKSFYTEKELIAYLLEEKALLYTKPLGITFLGREPLSDPFFCKEVGKEMKCAGMDLQIHTCGMCSMSAFDLLCGVVDLYTVRLVSIDPGSREQIPIFDVAQTLRAISFLEKRSYPYRILIPVLSEVNGSQAERLSRFAAAKKSLKSVILDFSMSGLGEREIWEYRKAFLSKNVVLY